MQGTRTFAKVLKITAWLTVFVFTLESVFGGQIPSVSPVRLPVVPATLPQGIGEITERYFPPAAGQSDIPHLIHIREAHANPLAQKNVARLLAYLSKEYGIQKAFVEAAGGKLDARYLQFSPNVEVNQQIARRLIEMGEWTGPDIYLYENKNASIEFQGVEHPDFYKESLGIMRKLFRRRPEIEKQLEVDRRRIISKMSHVRSKDLRSLLRMQLQKGTIPFQFFDARTRKEFPNLTRLARLNQEASQVDGVKAKKEWLKITRKFSIQESFETLCASPHLRTQMERLASRALNKGFHFKDYPEFSRWARHQIYKQELVPEEVTHEISRLIETTSLCLARNDKEREIIQEVREFVRMSKLLRLELTREEWNSLSLRARRGGREVTEKALRFYELARFREEFFFKSIRCQMEKKNTGPIIFISGGFHTQGVTEFARRQGWAYTVMTPRVDTQASPTLYTNAILGKYPAVSTLSQLRWASALNQVKRFGVHARARLQFAQSLGGSSSFLPVDHFHEILWNQNIRRFEPAPVPSFWPRLRNTFWTLLHSVVFYFFIFSYLFGFIVNFYFLGFLMAGFIVAVFCAAASTLILFMQIWRSPLLAQTIYLQIKGLAEQADESFRMLLEQGEELGVRNGFFGSNLQSYLSSMRDAQRREKTILYLIHLYPFLSLTQRYFGNQGLRWLVENFESREAYAGFSSEEMVRFSAQFQWATIKQNRKESKLYKLSQLRDEFKQLPKGDWQKKTDFHLKLTRFLDSGLTPWIGDAARALEVCLLSALDEWAYLERIILTYENWQDAVGKYEFEFLLWNYIQLCRNISRANSNFVRAKVALKNSRARSPLRRITLPSPEVAHTLSPVPVFQAQSLGRTLSDQRRTLIDQLEPLDQQLRLVAALAQNVLPMLHADFWRAYQIAADALACLVRIVAGSRPWTARDQYDFDHYFGQLNASLAFLSKLTAPRKTPKPVLQPAATRETIWPKTAKNEGIITRDDLTLWVETLPRQFPLQVEIREGVLYLEWKQSGRRQNVSIDDLDFLLISENVNYLVFVTGPNLSQGAYLYWFSQATELDIQATRDQRCQLGDFHIRVSYDPEDPGHCSIAVKGRNIYSERYVPHWNRFELLPTNHPSPGILRWSNTTNTCVMISGDLPINTLFALHERGDGFWVRLGDFVLSARGYIHGQHHPFQLTLWPIQQPSQKVCLDFLQTNSFERFFLDASGTQLMAQLKRSPSNNKNLYLLSAASLGEKSEKSQHFPAHGAPVSFAASLGKGRRVEPTQVDFDNLRLKHAASSGRPARVSSQAVPAASGQDLVFTGASAFLVVVQHLAVSDIPENPAVRAQYIKPVRDFLSAVLPLLAQAGANLEQSHAGGHAPAEIRSRIWNGMDIFKYLVQIHDLGRRYPWLAALLEKEFYAQAKKNGFGNFSFAQFVIEAVRIQLDMDTLPAEMEEFCSHFWANPAVGCRAWEDYLARKTEKIKGEIALLSQEAPMHRESGIMKQISRQLMAGLGDISSKLYQTWRRRPALKRSLAEAKAEFAGGNPGRSGRLEQYFEFWRRFSSSGERRQGQDGFLSQHAGLSRMIPKIEKISRKIQAAAPKKTEFSVLSVSIDEALGLAVLAPVRRLFILHPVENTTQILLPLLGVLWETCDTRAEFLAVLLGKRLQPAGASDLREAGFGEIVNAVAAAPPAGLKERVLLEYALTDILSLFIPECTQEQILQKIRAIFDSCIHAAPASAGDWDYFAKHTWLESHKNYERIRQLWLEGRIFGAAGSVWGKAMQAVLPALRETLLLWISISNDFENTPRKKTPWAFWVAHCHYQAAAHVLVSFGKKQAIPQALSLLAFARTSDYLGVFRGLAMFMGVGLWAALGIAGVLNIWTASVLGAAWTVVFVCCNASRMAQCVAPFLELLSPHPPGYSKNVSAAYSKPKDTHAASLGVSIGTVLGALRAGRLDLWDQYVEEQIRSSMAAGTGSSLTTDMLMSLAVRIAVKASGKKAADMREDEFFKSRPELGGRSVVELWCKLLTRARSIENDEPEEEYTTVDIQVNDFLLPYAFLFADIRLLDRLLMRQKGAPQPASLLENLMSGENSFLNLVAYLLRDIPQDMARELEKCFSANGNPDARYFRAAFQGYLVSVRHLASLSLQYPWLEEHFEPKSFRGKSGEELVGEYLQSSSEDRLDFTMSGMRLFLFLFYKAHSRMAYAEAGLRRLTQITLSFSEDLDSVESEMGHAALLSNAIRHLIQRGNFGPHEKAFLLRHIAQLGFRLSSSTSLVGEIRNLSNSASIDEMRALLPALLLRDFPGAPGSDEGTGASSLGTGITQEGIREVVHLTQGMVRPGAHVDEGLLSEAAGFSSEAAVASSGLPRLHAICRLWQVSAQQRIAA
ncbi:MAG: hypothetical protein HY586_07485 [Candidatus Omnitrophica bacterium]|nr:hypothetical protein [Candidatus Omnitrophota bacterium]